jgi:DNA polymerase III epsilon subunit-like protein
MTAKITSRAPVAGIPFVAFDTETTGLDLLEDRLLDVGAVRFRDGSEERSFTSLVRPGRPIPEFTIAIHHITETMAESAPQPKAVLEKLFPVLDGAVLLAHNAPFDMAVLSLEAKRQGLKLPDVLCLDTCVLADALMRDRPSLKLGELMRFFGCAETNDHRALPDARCVVRLFERLCRSLGGEVTWGDLIAKHGPPFSLRDFAALDTRDMWHYAVAVNAIEERRPLRIKIGNGAGHREIQLKPRGFELKDGRWCLTPEKPRTEPVYMDSVKRMVKRIRATQGRPRS